MCATRVTAIKPNVPCMKYLWNSLASLDVRPVADLFSSDIVFTPQHKVDLVVVTATPSRRGNCHWKPKPHRQIRFFIVKTRFLRSLPITCSLPEPASRSRCDRPQARDASATRTAARLSRPAEVRRNTPSRRSGRTKPHPCEVHA